MQKKKAVSLIVLVITIIVMIILAGAIILTLEKTNIINIAASVTDSVEIASEKEAIQMAVILAESTNKTGRITKDKIQKSIDELTAENSAKVYDLDGNFIIIFESKRAYTIDSNGEVLGMQEDYQNLGKVFLAQVSDSTYGTAEKPYEINCIEDLVDLSFTVNGIEVLDDGTLSYTATANKFNEKNINLIQNLSFTSELSYENATRTDYGDINGNGKVESLLTELTTGTGWIPIGNGVKNGCSFWGKFNGEGNKISNLYINNEEEVENLGFFGFVHNGIVTNLSLSGNIYCNANYAGGIIGYIYISQQVIDSCSFSGKIQNINTNVSTTSAITGGVVGCSKILITNSYNEATVIGNGYTGGIGGAVGDAITNCYNTGTINGGTRVGGIVGDGGTNVENCYNTGEISASGNDAGGIVGCVYAGSNKKIYKCYNTGNVSGNTYVGGILGRIYSSQYYTIEQCYNIGEITGTTQIAGMVGSISGQYSRILNCYNRGDIKGSTGAAGIGMFASVASRTGAITVSCYNTGLIDATTKYSILHNFTSYNSYFLSTCGATDKNATSVEETALKASASTLDKKIAINETDNTVTISETETQNVWVTDSSNINDGYPIFRWQLPQNNSRRIKNIWREANICFHL